MQQKLRHCYHSDSASVLAGPWAETRSCPHADFTIFLCYPSAVKLQYYKAYSTLPLLYTWSSSSLENGMMTLNILQWRSVVRQQLVAKYAVELFKFRPTNYTPLISVFLYM